MPSIPEQVLATIVARVRAPVPHRPRPKPKPRASWHGLKVGDRLTNGMPNVVVWEVEGCDSGGAYLRVVTPYRGNSVLYLTSPERLAEFFKVKKPPKPRKCKGKL